MEISPILLAKLLLYSVLWGGIVGALYDVNRIVRVFFGVRYSKKHFDSLYSLRLPFSKKEISLKNKTDKTKGKFIKGAVVLFGDLLSVTVAAVGIVVLNYSYNDGRFRAFTVIGTLVGFLIYYFSLGKLVMLACEPLAFLIKYAICAVFVILGYPIKFFLYFLLKFVRKICFLLRLALEKRRKKVYNIKELDYLLEMAKNGFLKKQGAMPEKEEERKHKEV